MFRKTVALTACAVALAAPTAARAQWTGAAYLGGNYTQSADVHVDQAARGTSLTFRDVRFEARPLESPQYYGGRLGRLFGQRSRYGLELEFIHLKVIARVSESYDLRGEVGGVPVGGPARMDTLVQRYSMTHGLNFILFNFVVRQPLRANGLALVGRAGAGPTYPHAESVIENTTREQYEWAGMGGHASLGVELPVVSGIAVFSEYKLTAARPKITVADGTGHMRAVTHQVAVGLALGRGR